MERLGPCCWPEIPAVQTEHLQASGPPGLLPPTHDRLPGEPARPDGIAAGPDGPAHGRRPGKPAAGRKRRVFSLFPP